MKGKGKSAEEIKEIIISKGKGKKGKGGENGFKGKGKEGKKGKGKEGKKGKGKKGKGGYQHNSYYGRTNGPYGGGAPHDAKKSVGKGFDGVCKGCGGYGHTEKFCTSGKSMEELKKLGFN